MAGRKKASIKLEKNSAAFKTFVISLARFAHTHPALSGDKMKYFGKNQVQIINEILGLSTTKNNLSNTNGWISFSSFKSFQLHADHIISVLDDSKKKEMRDKYSVHRRFIKKKFELLEQNNSTGLQKLKSEQSQLINFFHETTWSCFERLENEIGEKKIQFFKKNGHELTVTLYPSQGDFAEWKGSAKLDEKNRFLTAVLYYQDSQSLYTHLMIQVDPMKKLEVCMAHMTFDHYNHHNIISKTIVLKIDKNFRVDATRENLKGLIHPIDHSTVPPEIRQFLLDRQKNRMSSPHSHGAPVYSLKELEKWNQANICGMYGNMENYRKLQGAYLLIYTKQGETRDVIVTDTLTISNDNHPELSATYFHQIDEGGMQECEGKVQINYEARVLSIFLDSSIKNETLAAEPVFLMVSIPPKGGKWDTLTGVIAGDRDNHLGPVGRLVVMIKKEDGKPINSEWRKTLAKFFKKFKELSFTGGPTNIYTFSKLRASVEGSHKA
jgi:hypothetical protein